MMKSSALRTLVLLLGLAGATTLPRAAEAQNTTQNTWTFFNVQVYNDSQYAADVCWVTGCWAQPPSVTIWPGKVVTLNGVSSFWSALVDAIGLAWPNTATWQSPQACVIHQNKGSPYPQWTCGVPNPPPGVAAVQGPLTLAQFRAWARTLRDQVGAAAQPLPPDQQPHGLRRLFKQAPRRPSN
jgi:hypothetical protein